MINYDNYIVGFLDVLGQKEAFISDGKYLGDIEDDSELNIEELTEKLAKAHAKTVRTIEILRDGFKSYYDSYTSESDIKVSIPDEKVELFKEMRKTEINQQVFSDCIVSYCKLKPKGEYYSQVVNSVYEILSAFGAMFLLSLAREKPFRAGIDLGLATPFLDEGIYGPAFFKAYELESKIAQYPRIVIGEDIINFLMNLLHKNPQLDDQIEYDLLWCQGISRKCLDMIVKDVDGVWILDYCGDDFLKGISEHSPDSSLEDVINKAYKFVHSEWKNYKDSGDRKLAHRYFLLRTYLISRLTKKEDPDK